MDGKYYRTVHSIFKDGFEYKVIKPTHSPMILTSRNGTPLAAVGFSYPNHEGELPMMVHRPKGDAADFQCLFPKEGEFMIVISNLTDFGTLKIDIGCENKAVEEVDPGAPNYLNAVNELFPLQTYEILGDQKDSLAFKLNAIKKEDGEPLAVIEDEASVEKKGTFYYVSVVPKNDNQSLIELFDDCYWHVPEYFVCKKKHLEGSRFMNLCATTISLRGAALPALNEVGISRMSAPVGISAASDYGYAARVSGGRHVDTRCNQTGFNYIYNVSSNLTGKLCCISLSITPKLIRRDQISDSELLELANLHIIEIQNGITKSFLEEFRKSGAQIFKESQCIICLEAGNDAIIYKCGHQCIHLKCVGDLKKCPMCRAPLIAMLPVE